MERLYIRLKKKITLARHDEVLVKHIAYIHSAETKIKRDIEQLSLHTLTEKDGQYVVIDSFMLLAMLQKKFPQLESEIIGPTETIIEIQSKKVRPNILFILFIWVVLFIGTTMTIMNFHYDVSMPEVHQKLYFIFTGERVEQPLWIQVPYSIGLGAGMILFLNHWFKKRLNEEPSPLEIELFKYEQNIEQYVRHYENELNNNDSP